MASRRSRAMLVAKYDAGLVPDDDDPLRRAAEEQVAVACLASPQHRRLPEQARQHQSRQLPCGGIPSSSISWQDQRIRA
eukprot:4094397-Alexandrium_andersonii.AAC.1